MGKREPGQEMGESVDGRGFSQCKGLEVRKSMVCSSKGRTTRRWHREDTALRASLIAGEDEAGLASPK